MSQTFKTSNELYGLVIYSGYIKLMISLSFQFWFAIMNGFSGQILFERWSIGFYNVVSFELKLKKLNLSMSKYC